jgi:hypothetical protein
MGKGDYGYTFDPFKLTGVSVPKERREEALEAVADFLKAEALNYIGKGVSPVSSKIWKRGLSTPYKDKKAEESSAGFANLELHGDLLDALGVEVKGKKLFYGIEGDKENAGKAEGNNIGSYGRKEDESKARRFIPLEEEGETFRREIVSGMRHVLEEFSDE